MMSAAEPRWARASAEASTLAARLPSLTLAARRIADTVAHGVHGRRRAGPGETFWQFRPFVSGEPASRIDWRRSARETRAFVREREWEAAETLWIWVDRSPSMRFASPGAPCQKLDRALVLALALADVAVRGGERVGLLGLTRAVATRGVVERFAEVFAAAEREPGDGLPPASRLPARARIALIGDFLAPTEDLSRALAALGGAGARGHLVVVADPVEETFPFAGHVEFLERGGPRRLRVPRAETWREAYLARLAGHRDALAAIVAKRGWDILLHRTDASAAAALLAVSTRLTEGS